MARPPPSCPTEDIATELTERKANVGGEPRLINPENVARFSSFGRAVEVTFNAGRSVMKRCTQKWGWSHYCEVVNSCFHFCLRSFRVTTVQLR